MRPCFLLEKKVEPNSNLGKAIKYLLKHKDGLIQFCFTPGAKLDNNKMEAMLKLIVLGRKNHYFFKSSVGAAVSDTILSAIATAKSAKINVFEYLTHLQRYSEEVRKIQIFGFLGIIAPLLKIFKTQPSNLNQLNFSLLPEGYR